MDKQEITALLEGVAAGTTTVEEAVLKLKTAPIREIEAYAKVDLHRGLRQGVPEVIYGAGKTPEHILGIARAMREAGIPVPEEYVLEGVYSDPNSTADATVALMSLPDPPTAIMYPDDFSYIGGRNALERLGLRIPEDVSAVGYDGIMLSQVLRPALTTWYQDAEEIGRASAKKLIEEIEAPDTSVPEQILVHGQLLVGRSVKNLSE